MIVSIFEVKEYNNTGGSFVQGESRLQPLKQLARKKTLCESSDERWT